MNRKRFLAWSFFSIWLFFIFFFSSQNGVESSNVSGGILKFLEEIIPLSLPNEITTFAIRKIAHFTEYAILGILTMNLVKQYKKLDKKLILLILSFCLFYAFTDEFHQLFVSNRSGNFWDVFIDSCGSLFGIIIYLLISKKRKTYKMYGNR